MEAKIVKTIEYIREDIVDSMMATAEDHAHFAGSENTREKPTDAFIKKAWDWIEDNFLSSNQQDRLRLYYEHFKNYMKGE